MLQTIHASKVLKLLDQRVDGKPQEFSITYVKKSTGEVVHYPAAILTSVHSAGSTINVLPVGECKPRKIRRCLITHVNGMKIYY